MDQIKRMKDVVRVYEYLFGVVNKGGESDVNKEWLITKTCYRHRTTMLDVVRIITNDYQHHEPPDNTIGKIYNTFRANEGD